MAINPEELKHLDDALVHEEEEPVPEGWGIYVASKFLSHVVLGVYGFMLIVTLLVRWTVHAATLPIVLMSTPVMAVLPVALAALYLGMVAPPEQEAANKRTGRGRFITVGLVYIAMQVITVLLWLIIDRTFTLR